MLVPTKSPSRTCAAFGGVGEDLRHRGREVGLERVRGAAGDHVGLEQLAHLREGVGHRRIGPGNLVLRQLVVLLRTGLAEVDVLEQVGEGPAVGAADRVGRDAGRRDRVAVLEEVVPVRRGLDACVRENGHVVPDGRLVGALEKEAVELPVDRAEVEPRLREALLDRVLREVDRLQCAALGEVRHEPRLRQGGDVGRVAALDRGREHRRRLRCRLVGDLHVRVLGGEAVENGLEGLALGAGPHRQDADVAGDVAGLSPGGGGSAGLVVVAATAGGEKREYADEQCEQNEPSLRHSRAPSLSVPS